MNDISDLERNLLAASKELSGSASKLSNGKERRYGAAYQALVRAGARPQIRQKYRGKRG